MDRQIGDYRLDHLIGQGSSGEVWLAWDQGTLGRPVAVKRVRGVGRKATADLAAEAEVLATIHHPHVVPVVAVVADDDGLAIVMPYLAGGSLAALLEERGALEPGEVVALLEPLAEAVEALERRGLVHGDIKPGNVLLTADGDPVLVDVGTARAVGRGAVGGSVGGSGAGPVLVGTPEYLDPAVAVGGEPGATSEVYSLGVLAYECLTGRVPNRGDPAEVVAVASAGAHRRLHSWPTVPDPVADVVESALDPEPARRPAGARRFAAALRAAVADGPSGVDQITLPGPTLRALAAPVVAGGRATVVTASPLEEPARSPGTDRPNRRLAASAVALASIVGLLAVGARSGPHDDHPTAQRQPSPGAAAASGSGCEVLALPPPDPPGQSEAAEATTADAWVAQVDVDGDGCAEMVRWDGHRLTVSTGSDVRAYRLGEPGDQMLLGDWDGDGAVTPALYRPATGEVLYVDRFPAEVGDREAAVRITEARPHGTASVRGPIGEPTTVGSLGPGPHSVEVETSGSS